MKFLALATLVFAPTIFAASTPFHCKTLTKSAFLTANGPAEFIEFLNISKVSVGDDTYHIQRDGHPYSGDDIGSDFSYNHERYNLARCQLRKPDSNLPKSYFRVHLSKDTSQCLTIGSAGASSTDDKAASKAFTQANTRIMKPCEGPSGSSFAQQIFEDTDQKSWPFDIKTVGSDHETSRYFVGFEDHKVFLLSEPPKSHTSPPGDFKLSIQKFG